MLYDSISIMDIIKSELKENDEIREVTPENLEETPIEVIRHRQPTGKVFIFDEQDLVKDKSMVGTNSAVQNMKEEAETYAKAKDYIKN